MFFSVRDCKSKSKKKKNSLLVALFLLAAGMTPSNVYDVMYMNKRAAMVIKSNGVPFILPFTLYLFC